MGYGLPAAIGAYVASDEKIILITGDGGFQMNPQELATLKEYDLNVIVFILNNSEFGIIRQWQESFYDMNPYQIKLQNPDFVKLAASYAIDGVRVDNLDDLKLLLQKNLTGPLVVEVIVESEDVPLPKWYFFISLIFCGDIFFKRYLCRIFFHKFVNNCLNITNFI